jgi:hypothetical protein
MLTAAAIFGVASHSTPANAQITVGTPVINQVNYSTTIGNEVHNETATNNSVAGTVGLTLTGDWYVPVPVGVAGLAPELTGILPISVGNLPVQIDSFDFTPSAKWVNGGGNTTDPVTKWTITATLYQQGATLPMGNAGPAGYSDPMVKTLMYSGTLTGNGVDIINNVDTTDYAPYVLGSGLKYYLAIDDYTSITVGNTYTNSTPTIVVTNEFGGTFGDSFTGFSASFTWATVPEPSTIALLAAGAAGLLFARRRFAPLV